MVDGVAEPRADSVDDDGAGVDSTTVEPDVDSKAAPAAMVRPSTPTAPTLPTATTRRERDAGWGRWGMPAPYGWEVKTA